MIYAPNRNYLWTYTFVQALSEAGLRHVVIAPGSRSTPLTMAFARHPDIHVYSHIDERGAAFMALGLALAHDAPAAVVCSSGTAAANFYPAVIEAHYAHVPLLILTADRPHELRDSGANQTVDQIKMFGDHALWSVDVALPEANPPDAALRNLRSLAARACALTDGMPKGVVHLNFPFRKPLEPTVIAGEDREVAWGAEAGSSTPRIERGTVVPAPGQIERLVEAMREAKRGLIICGPRTPQEGFPAALHRLAAAAHFPIMADPLSGLRYQRHSDGVLAHYDTFLRALKPEPPDLILHFGAMPVSQTLIDYLNLAHDAQSIWVSADDAWSDADHRTTEMLHADPARLCAMLAEALEGSEPSRVDEAWGRRLWSAEWAVAQVVGDESAFFDAQAVVNVVRELRDGYALFVASSLAVRHLDQFGQTSREDIRVYCNRGASGIDGTISSALGVAAANPDQTTVLITGDLAFYHDMNALLAAKRNSIRKLVIVLLNNNGGQIFRRLPINDPDYEPHFTELFLTPHGLTFEQTAAQFGFAYARANDRDDFCSALHTALAGSVPSIVEVITNPIKDAERRQALMDAALDRIRSSSAQNLDEDAKRIGLSIS